MANRLASLIISLYIAAFIYSNAFFIQTLTILDGADQLFWNHLAVFLILLLPIHLLMNRVVDLPSARGAMRHVRTVLLSAVFVGLSIAFLYHIVPLEPIFDLPAQVDSIFSSETAFTIWLIVPLLVLFI